MRLIIILTTIFFFSVQTISSQGLSDIGSRMSENSRSQNNQESDSKKKKTFDEMEMPEIDDLMDSVMVKRWKQNSYTFDIDSSLIDTNIIGIQQFEARRRTGHQFHNRLSEIGQAVHSYIPSEDNRFEKYLPIKNFRYHITDHSKINYFKANYPYSRVIYYGPFFKSSPLAKTILVEHGQTVTSNWVVGFSGEYFNYEGIYPNEESSNTQLNIFSNFSSDIYDNMISFSYTTHELEENGGLTSDSLLQSADAAESKLTGVKRKLGYRNFAIDQSLKFDFVTHKSTNYSYDTIYTNTIELKKDSFKLGTVINIAELKNFKIDTISITNQDSTIKQLVVKTDSSFITDQRIDTVPHQIVKKSQIRFIHNYDYNFMASTFKDENFGNINNKRNLNIPSFNLNTKEHRDQNIASSFSNQFSVQANNFYGFDRVQAGIKYNYTEYSKALYDYRGVSQVDALEPGKKIYVNNAFKDTMHDVIQNYDNFSLNSLINIKIPYLFRVEAFANYHFSGLEKNQFLLNTKVSKKLNYLLDSKISIENKIFNRPLSYYERFSPTNIYNWNDKSFSDEKLFQTRVNYEVLHKENKKRYWAKASFTNLSYKDYYYYNEKALPEQMDVNIQELGLEARVDYGDLNFYTKAIFTKTDNNNLSIPKLNIYSSISYALRFYTLRLRPGIDFRMHSNYYAPSYAPTIAQFINQREREYGNYPYADLFINFKLAQVQFFVKYDNFLTLFDPKQDDEIYTPKYFNAKGHPYDGLENGYDSYRLKVGIIWKLFN